MTLFVNILKDMPKWKGDSLMPIEEIVFFELEKMRKAFLNKALVFTIPCWFFAAAIITHFQDRVEGFVALFSASIYTIVINYIGYLKYQRAYKEKVVKAVVRQLLPDAMYRPEGMISEHDILKAQVFAQNATFKGSDLLSGHYKDVLFEMSDVSIGKAASDAKREKRVPNIDFRGRWITVDFNKEFSGYHLLSRQFTPGDVFLFNGEHQYRTELIEMEDLKFNGLFNFYTSDKKEAYYLITPAMMDGMSELMQMYEYRVSFIFVSRKLHIVIWDGKDAFEPPVLRAIDASSVRKIEEDLSVIVRFIDELRLNRNIFKS